MDYYDPRRRALRAVRQLLYPRECPFCGRVLGDVRDCPDCAVQLETLRRKPGIRLDPAQHYISNLAGAAAPYRYNGCVRRGILHTKYHAAPWAAVELGLWLAKLAFGSEMHMAGAEPVPELVEGMSLGYDCIVPVPLHTRRLLARGDNQAAYIAEGIASRMGVPVEDRAVSRLRNNPSQTTRSSAGRWENVRDLFAVARPGALAGRHVLLVDDVVTTGSTLLSCTEALLRAVPDCRVSIAALAVSRRHFGLDR